MNKKNLIILGSVVSIAIVMLALFSLAPNPTIVDKVADAGETTEKGFKGSVVPSEFSELIGSGEYVVIDIRTQAEYDNGHITASPLLIDYYQSSFEDELDQLDKNGKYLIYCNSGNRSGSAVAIMEEAGFTNFYELSGGITSWNQVGLEIY